MSIRNEARLALNGGGPVIATPFSPYNSIGVEELAAATDVVRTGVLSRYLGGWGPDFNGGPMVKAFETEWASAFGVEHAVAMNSLTSGLIAAVGALRLEPGDEIIVSPWTMCASATAPLHWNAIPVFADIDPKTYCLDPSSVEAVISDRTRAIVAVDIFGQSADMTALRAIANKHGLRIISDTAQAPRARYATKWAGTLGDIGGYSLNYHKHFHTGEGGVMVTNDDELANGLRLIRNHAEAVVERKGDADLRSMIGFNFRLGELEAAIGREQLRKADDLTSRRRAIAERLSQSLSSLPGLSTPYVRPDATHVYYIYAMQLDTGVIGVSRERLHKALGAEGVPHLNCGYTNIHRLPVFQKKTAFGSAGFPWTASFARQDIHYEKGTCPVAERLHDETCLTFEICQVALDGDAVDLISAAFHKVWNGLDQLR